MHFLAVSGLVLEKEIAIGNARGRTSPKLINYFRPTDAAPSNAPPPPPPGGRAANEKTSLQKVLTFFLRPHLLLFLKCGPKGDPKALQSSRKEAQIQVVTSLVVMKTCCFPFYDRVVPR